MIAIYILSTLFIIGITSFCVFKSKKIIKEK
jgi:hypothetical protein